MGEQVSRYGTIQQQCLGKTKWRTEKAARWSLQELRQRGADLDRLVRPFRCSACRSWHLGHAA